MVLKRLSVLIREVATIKLPDDFVVELLEGHGAAMCVAVYNRTTIVSSMLAMASEMAMRINNSLDFKFTP